MKTNGNLRLTVTGIALSAALVALNGCLNDDDDFFDSQAQLNTDIGIIENYLDQQGISAQVDDVTQIRYVVHEQGTGLQHFVFADSLTLSYEVRILESGEVFERATNEKRRASSLFFGVLTTSALIQEEGSVTAYLPSAYGFGNAGTDEVPPNTVLQIDLELEALHDQQLEQEIQVIEDSLNSFGFDTLEVVRHPTGIFYTVDQPGNGRNPRYNQNVTVNFEGRLLGNSTPFDQDDNANFFIVNPGPNVSGLIPGWVVMLRDMRVGEQRTVYIPGTYAFGQEGRSGIPPNAPVEFDIELVSINN